jgi:hypothetical protein
MNRIDLGEDFFIERQMDAAQVCFQLREIGGANESVPFGVMGAASQNIRSTL